MDIKATGLAIKAAIDALSLADTDSLRSVRKAFSRELRDEPASEILQLAKLLIRRYQVPNFVAYELLENHKTARASLDDEYIDDLTQDLNSWWTVDAFACCLAGIAWNDGHLSDLLIHKWARSDNVWIRRAALASTVPLNNRTRGGSGDVKRTLAVCDILIADREAMVIKAMSWALRELAKRHPGAVEAYLAANRGRLVPRVIREVTTKLTTGRKNPAKAGSRHARSKNLQL